MRAERSSSESTDGIRAVGADEATSQDEPPRKKLRVGSKEDSLGPSCCSCRKKKTKCSRDQPCTNCVKLGTECIYDEFKTKPGPRPGAVESLGQRVSALENMFVGQGILWQQIWQSLNRQGDLESGNLTPSRQHISIRQQSTEVRQNFANLASTGQIERSIPIGHSTGVSKPSAGQVLDQAPPQPSMLNVPELPPYDLVDSLVEIYFRDIHPWIPMLHVRKFRAALAIPSERANLTTILQAIVSLCVRFSDDSQLQENPALRSWYSTKCRQAVILQSMETFSVQNLQAMIICAFDTIGSGRGPSAWSIVGSMARTVEQLRLSKEEDESLGPTSVKSLIRRMAFLPPSTSWQEAEERRRVFWNVFLMDRFCSISTGWNLSLTSADVHRRLPCEGAIWEESEQIQTPTPYFGILDQSQNRKDYIPSVDTETEEEQASLGGFAFCIEATESLSLVTSFFLQHEVDFSKAHDIQKWLMRFKQLDLRLIQWKVLLPEKWREACAVNEDGNLDPNLILAHITHNTAVVLLHQGLAYPSPEWKSIPAKLPSISSAETCYAAATEVSSVAMKFLQTSHILTNPQFAFCLFVCGRMLLTHAVHLGIPIPAAFGSIVQSLDEMSKRWSGNPANANSNLASKFRLRLLQAYHSGDQGQTDIREEAFSEKNNAYWPPEMKSASANQGFSFSAGFEPSQNGGFPIPFHQAPDGSPDSVSLAFPPLPNSFHAEYAVNHSGTLQDTTDSSLEGQETASIGGPSAFDNTCSINSDVYSFLDQTFLPDQRVSMLSRFIPE